MQVRILFFHLCAGLINLLLPCRNTVIESEFTISCYQHLLLSYHFIIVNLDCLTMVCATQYVSCTYCKLFFIFCFLLHCYFNTTAGEFKSLCIQCIIYVLILPPMATSSITPTQQFVSQYYYISDPLSCHCHFLHMYH